MELKDDTLGLIPDDVHRELLIDWAPTDYSQLLCAFEPYVTWIKRFLCTVTELPSHIPNSGSIAVPIGSSTTPEALFSALGDSVHFECREYSEFWVTVHYPNPEPVVTLLPKQLPGTPAKLVELCDRCTRVVGSRVGGANGMFLAWLLPGFSWAMHTDHDNPYEKTAARVHVPLITNPASLYVWGRKDGQDNEIWLLSKHLEPFKAHLVRVDVPHTVVNGDIESCRLHLVLDVH
jgi:hypothetical protein